MLNFIRNLGSGARTSSDRSSQPNRHTTALRNSLRSNDSVIQANPPPYSPRSATSRESTTHSQDSDSSHGSEAVQYLHEHNTHHSAPTQHHRESSTGTSLPPLNEENAGSEEPVIRPTSHSSTACTCTPLQGCCSDHNSIRTPNPAPLELLGTPCNVFINTPNTSLFTLAPIHHSIQYHLSMNNLNCISRRLNPETESRYILELSLAGSATSDTATQYRWSSEIYFDKGTFLQKQEIRAAFWRDDENPPEHFTGCPHQSLSVYTPDFTEEDGICEAEAWITCKPSRCPSHPMQKWSNSQGPYTHITSCTICHSDTECYIQLNGWYLDVRYTCFRDLGAGTDPNDPKWRSLLTGGGINHRPKYEFDVLRRVWHTALHLKRSDLYDVIHQTPNGLFHVRSKEHDEA
ncbi:hypothetical protein GGI42DRAFT_337761 [Trichoderma sp. SZMC 28013]